MNLRRQNILLITSDQQHYATLGALDLRIRTPNLDRLAAQGTLFNRAYCPNPTCSPTRASLITGKYPSQHGCWALGTKLPESETTIGELLGKDGYRTALIGKAHFQHLFDNSEFPSLESFPLIKDLDFWRKYDEPFYGFQHVELTRNHTDEAWAGQHYGIWLEEKGCKDWNKYFPRDFKKPVPEPDHWAIPEELHYSTWVAERSMAMLDNYAESKSPFFLWASFADPHPPYGAPSPWSTMVDPAEIDVPQLTPGEFDDMPPHFAMTQEADPDFSMYQEPGGNTAHGMHSHLFDRETMAKNIAIYYGMISLMDKYIGKILDHLEAKGLAENTLVVFTSDHGHFIGQHGLKAKGPFHYEDLIRVPFIARWPERIPAGKQSSDLVSLVDLPVTFLAAAGVTIPRTMTGKDLGPSWSGEAGAYRRDHILVENRHQPTTIHVKTYVDERYKITVYYNHPYGELFDLQQDPGELVNLWDRPDHAALKTELLLKLLHANMGIEPLWMPRVSAS